MLLHNKDIREVIEQLDDDIQCIVTSPPYFGLRDNGIPGELGNEPCVDDYTNKLVHLFEDLSGKLTESGTMWVNMGDRHINGELQGIPWRFTLKMCQRGFFLVNEIIWAKGTSGHKELESILKQKMIDANIEEKRAEKVLSSLDPFMGRVMPSSAKRRFHHTHEHLFLFALSPNYYFDMDSVREEHKWTGYREYRVRDSKNKGSLQEPVRNKSNSTGSFRGYNRKGKARRSVWTIPVKTYKGQHFSVFPQELIEPCILSCTKPGDLVFDPFAGTGTTLEVALNHNRKASGCEINKEYVKLIEKRLNNGAAVKSNS
jgi:DNA modification methylase